MRDTDLYRQLLGLEKPWSVDRDELDVKQQRVDVFAKHEKAKWSCPECGKPCGLHDHDEERVWRHLDSCGFLTFLHARIPRVGSDEPPNRSRSSGRATRISESSARLSQA